jgi:hypothetical protein
MRPTTPALLATLALLALPLSGCDFGSPSSLPATPQVEPAQNDPAVDPVDLVDDQLPADYPWDTARPPQLDGMALMQLPTGRDISDTADELEGEARDDEPAPEDSEPIEGGYSSFLVGAASLLVMEAGAFVVLAPPSLVLQDTYRNGTATQVAWNAWDWSKTTVIGDTTFVATLSGELTWTGYALAMVVDAYGPDGVVQDYLWYDGTVSWDGNLGEWTLYDFDGAELGWYDYDLDGAGGGVASLELPIGVLTAAVDGDARELDFEDLDGLHLTVTWHAVTAEGSVVNPTYNGGDEACWNADLQNVACY